MKPFEYHPVQLSPDHVDIAITHCGICGTDIHKIDSGWGPSAYPMIPGQHSRQSKESSSVFAFGTSSEPVPIVARNSC